MTKKATSYKELLKRWGSYQKIADDCDTTVSAVKGWAQKNHILPRYFNPIVRSAKTRRVPGVTLQVLADIAEDAAAQ